MSDDLGDRFDEAKTRMEAEERLRADRVERQDTLVQEEYHLKRLDVGLEQLREGLDAVENPGITGLVLGMFMHTDAKLDRARTAVDTAQQEYDALDTAVTELRSDLEAIEQQISEIGDTRADFASLCVQKEQLVLDRADATADQLREVLEKLASSKEEARKTHVAAEAAEAAIKRLVVMYKALMRARKGQLHAMAAPMIGSAWNVLKARGAKEHVARVREGLQKLHHRLTSLDIATDAPYDLEITRMTPMIEHIYTVEMVSNWEQWAVLFSDAGHPTELEVQTLLGHLEERLSVCRTEADTLERHRHGIVENA